MNKKKEIKNNERIKKMPKKYFLLGNMVCDDYKYKTYKELYGIF